MRIKLSFVGLLLAASVAVVGCGGDDKGGTTSGTPTKDSAAPAATSAAPAATSAAPSAEPASASAEAGEDGEKGHKGKKGKHGAKKKGKGGKGKKGGKGGKDDDDDDDDDDSGVEMGEWIHIKKIAVEVRQPKGWKEAKKKEWTILKSPDGDAWLGFVEYDNPNAGAKKLEAVAEMFEVKDVQWTPVRDAEVGEGHFPAKIQDGKCKFGDGKEGDISFAAVNPPGKGELLIVYVVKADGKPMARAGAIAAVKSLRVAEKGEGGKGGKGKGGKKK